MNDLIAENRATERRAKTGTITGSEIPILTRMFVRARHAKSAPATVKNVFVELKFLEEFLGANKFLASAGMPDNDVWVDYVSYISNNYHGNYAQRIVVQAKALLQWLYQGRVLKHDCTGLARTPESVPPKPKKGFTASQYYQILEAAKTYRDGEWLWPVVAGWNTGASIGDVCLLKWASMDWESMMLNFGRIKLRGNSVQNVPIILGSEFHQMLHERWNQPRSQEPPNDPANDVYFMDTHLAQRYMRAPQVAARPFRELLTSLGFAQDYSYHSFRHGLCSRAINSGMSTATACRITGHKDPKVFLKYVKADTKFLHQQYAHSMEVAGALGGVPKIKEAMV